MNHTRPHGAEGGEVSSTQTGRIYGGHTPGPWDYDGGPSGEIIAPTKHKNAHGHTCAQLVAVATMRCDLNDGDDGHPERSEEEVQANAALIAAAPELLEVLERVEDYLSGRGQFYTPDVVALARAAITKAHGSSTEGAAQ